MADRSGAGWQDLLLIVVDCPQKFKTQRSENAERAPNFFF
jgi:hypothetical protein